ncbi:MAG: hypothetical protein ACI9QQ_001603 [Myxococcota bacterium]
MKWQPPERPTWAQRLIEHGDMLGGASQLVSLKAQDLLDTAMSSTGLSDFSGDDWRDHFEVLVRALDEESDLHLIGRIMARTELLRSLRNRLLLAQRWAEQPEILDEEIEAPVFIIGSPRSGTSILHELMAQDTASRAPLLWEMNHPMEAINGDAVEAVAEAADKLHLFWQDVQPEYETMHANSGHLPNECIFITMHEFLSDHWGGNHNVPSYDKYLQRSDQRSAYRYHKRFLQTLQHQSKSGAGNASAQRNPSKRWLLKAPSHLFQMKVLFDVYPDARIVRTHRDPLKTLASSLSLMGTLKWMRCNNVDMSRVPGQLAFGYAYIYQKEMEQRKTGALPDAQFVDVCFDDIVKNPARTIDGVYEKLGWQLGDKTRDQMTDYAANKPKGSRGAHAYTLEDSGLDAKEERERYAFYIDQYGIREE